MISFGARGRATFSDCLRYRYTLSRDLGFTLPECSLAFVMLNPSTADADVDDRTIRRCIGYARDWGFRYLEIVNLFAFRATQPADMKAQRDPVGPGNDSAIAHAAADADLVVCAWGNHGAHRGRSGHVLELLEGNGARVSALKITGQGQPWHPLYLKKDLWPSLSFVAGTWGIR